MSKYIELPPLRPEQEICVNTLAGSIIEHDKQAVKAFLTSKAAKDENVLHEALYMAGIRDNPFILDLLCQHAQKVVGPDFWQKGREGKPLPHRMIAFYDSFKQLTQTAEWQMQERICRDRRDAAMRAIGAYVASGCPIDVVDENADEVLKSLILLPKEKVEFKTYDLPFKEKLALTGVAVGIMAAAVGGAYALSTHGGGVQTIAKALDVLMGKTSREETKTPAESGEKQKSEKEAQIEQVAPNASAPAQPVQSASVPQKISSRAKAPVFVAGLDFSRQRG